MKANNYFTIVAHVLALVLAVSFASDAEESCGISLILPDHVKCRFAGNTGFISAGAGYSFFDGKLDADLIYGYVDRSHSEQSIHQLTQKNTYHPISVTFPDYLIWQPLTFGAGFLYKVGNNNRETWLLLPERYPKRYYFATAFHVLITVGTSFTYNGPGLLNDTGVFVETGTTALYLRNWIREDYVGIPDIFSLGIGIKKSFH